MGGDSEIIRGYRSPGSKTLAVLLCKKMDFMIVSVMLLIRK
ncbi:hypothetical protein ROSEINA2194_00572 [Roseburia inulinivorans DSM 16841]|uniref:Uncharacterized protein n=1 Tax=Roseburia inulinivorans DSM 16841 TaxID=622312 RepID=C0FPC0_9FIRM|nr:hypothetical protein ROSEINA2194_00572 [Roseburia inulinivorans DSM 16841]